MSTLITIAQKLGLDKSIAYSSGARVVQGFTGVGSMFFISTFLTGVEQGFYFTFGSILALQVFFELGLTGIMTQYVAHESSHLTLDESGAYQGEEKYKSRLSSLLHFCIKWYALLSILVLTFLIVLGIYYFNRYGNNDDNINWEVPWILICIVTSIQLFIAPITSIISGLGFIKDTSKISFYQQLIVPCFTWIGLVCGVKLYILGLSHGLAVIIWLYFVIKKKYHHLLRSIWNTEIREKVSYMKEIFPYQWKIALSWISGYFIFQLFNPVLFATEGAVVAGQMGLTLQALNAINAFSMSWMNTKVPMFSGLIAQKKYLQLDAIFSKTLKQMNAICAFMLIAFFLFVASLRLTQFRVGEIVIAERFLDYVPMLLMMVPIYVGQYVGSWATYLRCHKQEPFLMNSIVAGILCLCSTFVFGNLFGLYGVTIGYCIIRISLCPWAYYIYIKKKKEWHYEYYKINYSYTDLQ